MTVRSPCGAGIVWSGAVTEVASPTGGLAGGGAGKTGAGAGGGGVDAGGKASGGSGPSADGEGGNVSAADGGAFPMLAGVVGLRVPMTMSTTRQLQSGSCTFR